MLQLDGKLGANDVCTFIYCLRVSKVFPFAPETGDITLALDKFHKFPIMLEFNTKGKAHASLVIISDLPDSNIRISKYSRNIGG